VVALTPPSPDSVFMFIQSQAPTDELMLKLLPMLEQAGQTLLEEYEGYCAGNDFNINKKIDQSPVTQADLKINHYILEQLAYLTPEIPVLSEESDYSKRHQWPLCWLLDPLDGTKEFIHERDEFTINLSLIRHHKTIFSVIVVPCEKRMYMGYLQDLPFRYQFSQRQWYQYQQNLADYKQIQVGLSHGSKDVRYQQFMDHIAQQYPVVRREAGSAYKFCMMLEGVIDIYPRFHPTSEWDTSAGQGLLESIGGGLLSLQKEPFTYNARSSVLNNGFIAFTNQVTRTLSLEALAQVKL
jgi:3'(2'), 5'-bisphosphate nucleotidase